MGVLAVALRLASVAFLRRLVSASWENAKQTHVDGILTQINEHFYVVRVIITRTALKRKCLERRGNGL